MNEKKQKNIMRKIKVEKVTLNIGAGKDQNKLEKGIKLLKKITGVEPVKTITKKRIPNWGLRPGLPIGCKITLRGKEAEKLLQRLLEAKDNTLNDSCADNNGNIAFGIHEYIDVPNIGYDPEIGIMGFQVCVTLQRPGYRINKRKRQRREIPKSIRITKEEALEFLKNKFNVKIGEKL